MNLPCVALAWALVQISILCSLALVVAWVMRGRKPEFTSAILSGTCLGSVILVAIAFVPLLQWTVAENLSNESGTRLSLETESTTAMPDHNAITREENRVSSQREDGGSSLISSQQTVAMVASDRTLERFQELLSSVLLKVDRNVRRTDEWSRPMAGGPSWPINWFLGLGFTCMGSIWLASWLYIQSILKSSRPIQDESLLKSVESISYAFGLQRIPCVRESEQIPIGATVGLWNVTILLHSDWRKWTEQERSAVISHEMAHAVRYDFLWVIVASWTGILLFFHPWIHVVIARLRLEQELAADQLAAGKMGDAKTYGRALARLALNCQLSLEASKPRLGSMLTVGEVCITRRVKMLLQGSLKPKWSSSRWMRGAIVATTILAIPIAGLRGTTQELSQIAIESVTAQAPPDDQEQTVAPASNRVFPRKRLQLDGTMVYRPGRLRAGEFGPEAAWLQDWIFFKILGQPLPSSSNVFADCGIISEWEDDQLEHGRLMLSQKLRFGQNTLPGQLTRLLRYSQFRVHEGLDSEFRREIDGRKFRAVSETPTSDKPTLWQVDDEQGFFMGTWEEAENYVRGAEFGEASIPPEFLHHYRDAAFAFVCSDCDTWHHELSSFFQGSKKEEEFRLLAPLFKDVQSIGFFANGCQAPACTLLATTKNDVSAQRIVKHLEQVIEVGKLAFVSSLEEKEKHELEDEIFGSFWNTVKVASSDSQVVVHFDIVLPSLDNSSIIANLNRIAGWQSFVMSQFPAISQAAPATVTVGPAEGTYEMPAIFSQTLDAENYRGKTVRLELDIQCNEEALDRAGVFAWASRYEAPIRVAPEHLTPLRNHSPYVGHRNLSARYVSCDGHSSIEKAIVENSTPAVASSDAMWRTVSIELEVPMEAEHISFGCCTSGVLVNIRNVHFGIISSSSKDAAGGLRGRDLLNEIPYNPLVVPGHDIRKEPFNLDFTQTFGPTSLQADRSTPANK
ncbi:M56 family metallopeptidase [Pirellulaceae bacterium SH449]